MSIVDWIGVVLLVPFGLAVLGLIAFFIAGCIGSGKRRRQVQIARAAARQAKELAAEKRRAMVSASTAGVDAADGM
jgi:hypothetical protein